MSNVYENAARSKKVLALVLVLNAQAERLGVSTTHPTWCTVVETMSAPMWAECARQASVKVPSAKTRAAIVAAYRSQIPA